MYITLLCVGKIKEKYWQQAIDEYTKRLGKYHQFKIITVADEKDPSHESPQAIALIKDKEAERLLKHIKQDDFVITLEIDGKQFDTLTFAKYLSNYEATNKTHLTFVIGGSFGLSSLVCERSNMALSFSNFTFPHQLMRVIFVEQIYRCARINAGQKYHK